MHHFNVEQQQEFEHLHRGEERSEENTQPEKHNVDYHDTRTV